VKTEARPRTARRQAGRQPTPPLAPAQPWKAAWWVYALGLVLAYLCASYVFSPAVNGPLLFDDLHLPFSQPAAILAPLKTWLNVRPLTMLSYYANLHLFGLRTHSFHVWNIVFHTLAAFLLYFLLRKILELASTVDPTRTILAVFGAALFLLHPMQSEGVAYIASRSENLGALFYFAAWGLFLYRRRQTISWPVSAGILFLFVAAVASKEITPTLIGVLLLTDYFFNPGFSWQGAVRNWRLYGPIVIAGLAGAFLIFRLIFNEKISIGFNLDEFTWYQYLFTQFRVFFAYLGLFLVPYWQTIDYDFAVSHNILEHGAIFYLVAILALAGTAFHYRRRFPLAAYGFFAFCLILSPTSTFIPVKDVIADRRLYLPMVGLILIALEFLRRWKIDRRILIAVLSAVCLSCAVWTYNRNQVWSSAIKLWEDAAEKSPDKPRVQFGVAVAYFQANRCKEAVDHYAIASRLQKPDYMVVMDWGMAYECNQQHDEALDKLKQSIDLHASAQAWANLAYVELKQGLIDQPFAALDKAQAIDPGYINTYIYRGTLHLALRQYPQAEANLKQAFALDPTNAAAVQGMNRLKAEMGAAGR
jgi:tetratricopeptide (TPR) repeat protein